jgi:hypothetical protein
VALAALYVVQSSAALPPVLASHFGPGGQANGAMPRADYVALMTSLVVGLPVLIALPGWLMRRLPDSLIRMPDRAHWLAPERCEATLAYMADKAAGFGGLLVVFLCYVHHLVVEANAVQPARLSEPAIFLGLGGFLAATVAWAVTFLAYFRRA